MRKLKYSIIYVNFAPYENTGYIQDFLISKFETVYVFIFDFHKLKSSTPLSRFVIFDKRRMIFCKNLITIPVPEKWVFILLPIRSLLIFIQLTTYLFHYRKCFTKSTIFFTVNAFTAWVGNILKQLHLVGKTIFWIWDYYPPTHSNLVIKLMRSIYGYFDKEGAKSDKVIFLNKRLISLRKASGVWRVDKKYSFVPIATNSKISIVSKNAKTPHFCFIGVLKKSQGLDLIFDISEEIYKKYGETIIEIIGDGPDKEYYVNRGRESKFKTIFNGLLSENIRPHELKIRSIMSKCNISLATYIPEKSNVSYYGDPSKIKRYLSMGLPVITTNVFEFSSEIKKSEAGIVINYNKPKELIKAIETILGNYNEYVNNVKQLTKKFHYEVIYEKLFSEL